MAAETDALFDLVMSHRVTAVVYVAARLGVADILAEGPATSERLAERTGAHHASLRRLLRALVSLGVCTLRSDDEYDLSPLGRPLAASAEQSLKPWVIFEGEMLMRGWAGLHDSVISGRTAAELAGVEDSFDLMGRDPRVVGIFNDAMVVSHPTPSSSELRLWSPSCALPGFLCELLRPTSTPRVFDRAAAATGIRRPSRGLQPPHLHRHKSRRQRAEEPVWHRDHDRNLSIEASGADTVPAQLRFRTRR
jgi:hypothetical protein